MFIPKLIDVMDQLRETVIGQEDAIFILTPMLYYHKLFATRLIQQYTKISKQSQVAYAGDDDCLRQQPVLLKEQQAQVRHIWSNMPPRLLI